MQLGARAILSSDQLQAVLDELLSRGYDILGPAVRDAAVVLQSITNLRQLPVGYADSQDGGTYRLEKTDSPALFGYVCGPQSWKQFLYPSTRPLLQVQRKGKSFEVDAYEEEPARRVFFGVRACELKALAIHDRVLSTPPFVDTLYAARRRNVFVVAVNCTRAGGTCFCASVGTGPKADSGFDLALTEVIEGGSHEFVVEVGTEIGGEVLAGISAKAAPEAICAKAEALVTAAAQKMGRRLETADLQEHLYRRFDSPHWEKVASRCLACGNCTMVCPTCFCVNVQDSTDLTGSTATRTRLWDSCFTTEFSYIHGGSIRSSDYSRYRQWLMHKLAYWPEQFGSLGCVGCGRCITWCPVGIDITEEARILREE